MATWSVIVPNLIRVRFAPGDICKADACPERMRPSSVHA
jgi:hypothetical protein